MYTEITIPSFCDRVIGFSIPESSTVWAMSRKGLHKIKLGLRTTVETNPNHAEDYEIFDTELNILDYKGIQSRMLGENGGEPILQSQMRHTLRRGSQGTVSASGESRESVDVVGADGKVLQQLRFLDTSGEWCHATFSEDGRYVVIGVPNHLYAWCRIDR